MPVGTSAKDCVAPRRLKGIQPDLTGGRVSALLPGSPLSDRNRHDRPVELSAADTHSYRHVFAPLFEDQVSDCGFEIPFAQRSSAIRCLSVVTESDVHVLGLRTQQAV